MNELKRYELYNIHGGSDPDGCSGCEAGQAFREWLSDVWDRLTAPKSGPRNGYYF